MSASDVYVTAEACDDEVSPVLAKVLGEIIERHLSPMRSKLEEVSELLSARRKDHYLVDEFAKLVGRSAYTVRRWIAEGKLKAIRVADGGPKGKLLIPRSEFERLIATGRGAGVPDVALG
jgi:excisionase family DNA binding protein